MFGNFLQREMYASTFHLLTIERFNVKCKIKSSELIGSFRFNKMEMYIYEKYNGNCARLDEVYRNFYF